MENMAKTENAYLLHDETKVLGIPLDCGDEHESFF
jgi:hypothetical protein